MTTIRDQRPDDATAVTAVLTAAFGGETEAELLRRMQAAGETLLALVAEDGDAVVGVIAFAQGEVRRGEESRAVAWLVPLGVAPHMRQQGIGTALVEAGLERCRSLGYAHTVVVGDARYYERFGFSREGAGELKSRWPAHALLAVKLRQDASPPQGLLVEPSAFAALD